ncbi:MAG TPA: TlpA disulfide reductase family protein [Gemmatimonadaceae bacterium]|jgi:thiol-disulfide isomerase/thioredoxin|nr:TlpA disulfide reductase family protein [Gemmatimonadaceae bacterium]
MSRIRITGLALAALALVAAPQLASAQDGGLPIGSTMPLALVQTLDGKPTALTKAIGEGPALIEFWATWCENCEKLLPTLQKVEAKYRGKVKFIGVAVSVNESANRVRLHVARHNVPGVQFYDYSGDATSNWDVPATSHVVVIDKKGKVVYTGVGGDQDLDAAIKKAL